MAKYRGFGEGWSLGRGCLKQDIAEGVNCKMEAEPVA